MSRWGDRDDVPRGEAYDERWRRLEAAGESVHGEADLISSFEPATVLDAGCGTGRVAIELARRGVDVVGVDLDPAMLIAARTKAPDITWIVADLGAVELTSREGGRRLFDVVALAGNVMIFLSPGSEPAVLANLARHIRPGGYLIAGFQLQPGGLDLETYDEVCAALHLVEAARWATWERAPFVVGGNYAVSVHQLAE